MNDPVVPAPNAPARFPAETIPEGDRQSLAELDRRFRPALKAYFLKRAPGTVDAEDLVQDVFVRLAKRGEIAAIRQVEGYVFQTAANVLTDRVRRRAVRRRDDHVPYLESDHRDEENSPENVLMGREALARLLMENDPLATLFREHFAIVVVPMLNPDGVAHGHWRLDATGTDLNRDWGPFERPETRLVRDLLEDLFARGAPPVLVLDFHSTTRDVLYTQPDDANGERAWFPGAWHEAINARVEGPPIGRNAEHNPGKPTLKSWVQDAHGIPGITFEIGDTAPRPRIEALARIGAEEAMRLLLAKPTPP